MEQVEGIKIKGDAKLLILIIALYCILAYMIITVLPLLDAFKMSKDLQKKSKILELCIAWNIENPVCSEIYGNIENSNGEPIH